MDRMSDRPFSLVAATADKLGGAGVLGHQVVSDADMARIVIDGFPLASVDALKKKGGMSEKEVSYLIIKPRTLSHRRELGRGLTPEESDRAERVARIIALTEETFGNKEKADRWLRGPLSYLDGQSPMEVVRTESGTRIIENTLARIAWGAAF